MRLVCCVCELEIGPEDGCAGTVGDVTHGYCPACAAWNREAWRRVLAGTMTNEQFRAEVRDRRRAAIEARAENGSTLN